MAININGVFSMDNLHSKMNLNPPIQECWINVYQMPVSRKHYYGYQFSNEWAAKMAMMNAKGKPCSGYRIHVKMKPRLPHIADYKWEDRFNGS